MDDRRGIDFCNAFEYPSLEFVEGLYTDMAQKASRHFAEQSLDDVQP